MQRKKSCVEPKIGKRIEEYNVDAKLSDKTKRLTIEERIMIEAHLFRCSFCRQKLNLEARMAFETTLVFSGYFLTDPVLKARRRRTGERFFDNKMSDEEFQTEWLELSCEEYEKTKSFVDQDV